MDEVMEVFNEFHVSGKFVKRPYSSFHILSEVERVVDLRVLIPIMLGWEYIQVDCKGIN